MADKKTKVEIDFNDGNGWTDVSSYNKGWKYTGDLNNRPDLLTIKLLKTIKDSYNLSCWNAIRVYEGWTTSTDRLIFKGIITEIKDEYNLLMVDCADEIYKLSKSNRVKVYNRDTDPTAGKISAIAKDMIKEVLPVVVEDSGTLNTLRQFITTVKNNVLERVSTLAKIIDYIILYDPEYNSNTGSVFFVSKGYWTNSNSLTLPNDATEIAKWKEDSTQLYNELTLYGSATSAESPQYLFSGDGTTKTFTIDVTPSDSVLVEVYDGSNWIRQTRGTEGVSASYDYWIDKPNKQINFVTAPASGTDNIRITTASQVPPVVRVRDESSIALYNKGKDSEGNYKPIPKTLTVTDVYNTEDALTRAKKLLSTYSVPFYTTTVQLQGTTDKNNYYKLGELITVTDASRNIYNREFLITRIIREYPGGGAKITIGDSTYRIGTSELEIKKRISDLEQQLQGDYQVLTDFLNVSHTNEFYRNKINVKSEDITGDYLIWDHPTYGVWDNYKWTPDGYEGPKTTLEDETYKS